MLFFTVTWSNNKTLQDKASSIKLFKLLISLEFDDSGLSLLRHVSLFDRPNIFKIVQNFLQKEYLFQRSDVDASIKHTVYIIIVI